MKIWFFMVLFWSHSVLAQIVPETRFLETQKTIVDPYALTLSLNSKGELNFLGYQTPVSFSLRPNIQIGYKSDFFEYSYPVKLDHFNFYPFQENLGTIEVKKRRYEFGLGATASVQEMGIAGIVPYRGGMQTVMKVRAPNENEKMNLKMPEALNELDSWRVGDAGTYQTIGGIHAYASLGAATLKVLNFSFGIQNQFIVQMKKISDDEITLEITEESLKKRLLTYGPYFAEGAFDRYKGSRFSARFTLNRTINSHYELFEMAIKKGNLTRLQEDLPVLSQKASWEGNDKSFYVGIPIFAGFKRTRSQYDLEKDGVETSIDTKTNSNEGVLRTTWTHQKSVYQNDQSMVIIWDSHMGKHTGKDLDNYFVSKGRIMGVEGFEASIPSETKLKNVITQLGVSFTHIELSQMKTVLNEELLERYRLRCMEFLLSCKDQKRVDVIKDRLEVIFELDGKPFRKEFGHLLLEEPALVYAFVKILDLDKEAYFKFLNEKFQSIEGLADIE